jgi:hypothetical protein
VADVVWTNRCDRIASQHRLHEFEFKLRIWLEHSIDRSSSESMNLRHP